MDIESKIERVTESGCWLWIGSLDRSGYAKFNGCGAHRAVYEQLVGPIPEGMQLDHLCRVRSCVNPAHTEPVTPKENSRRSFDRHPNAHRTHCKRGHEFTAENTNTVSGKWRQCATCKAMLDSEENKRRKVERARIRNQRSGLRF